MYLRIADFAVCIAGHGGWAGGGGWQGAAVDPETGMLYVPSATSPIVVQLVEPEAGASDFNYMRGGVTSVARRLEDLEQAPRAGEHALGGEQDDDVRLVDPVGEEGAQVGEGRRVVVDG